MQFDPGEINIVCSDMDASLRFYRDVLGMRPWQDEDGYTHLRHGGRSYLLLPGASALKPAAYGSLPQFSLDLVVDDLAAALAYLEEHGVSIDRPLPANGYFVARDPDGLPWEIVQRGA